MWEPHRRLLRQRHRRLSRITKARFATTIRGSHRIIRMRKRLGIPSRLPAASRPNPRPISDSELQQLSIVAKKLFPPETSLSFCVWLQFTNETERAGRRCVYLNSAQTDKEALFEQIARRDSISEGLVAILSAVEPDLATAQVLHLYDYYRLHMSHEAPEKPGVGRFMDFQTGTES
jgi:hypothetical protein